MTQKLNWLVLVFYLTSSLGLGESARKKQAAPELVVPQFDFEGGGSGTQREPANQDEAKDLLSELEGLLENPAQRDAKTQLGIPEGLIDPLPQMKADIPIKNPEKVESVKVIPQKRTTPKVVARAPIQKPKKSVRQTNELVSVDFFAEEKAHKIVVQASGALKYRMTPQKDSKQIVYVFEKTSAPKKLRRSYDTKEFKSAILNYSLNQTVKKKIPSTRLVIQFRDFQLPKAILSDNRLVLEFEDKSKKKTERLLASELPNTSFGEEAFDSGRGYRGEPIEKLELKNTDVAEAIKLVVRSSGYNVVLGDDVKGNIGSLSLQNIPWDQALHIILQMKKLGFVRKGNLVRVASLESLKAEQAQLEQQEELEPLKTVLIPVSYAKSSELAPRAQPFLSKRGKLDTDERTNTIIIRDVESVVSRLQKLFAVLDTQPPAVSISAKFIEVKKGYTQSLGLGILNLAGQTSGINFGSAQASIAGPGFEALPTGGTINLSAPKFAALQARLILGETDKKVRVLANPTITVQQGQQGSIIQGKTTDVPQQAAGLGTVTTGLTQTANLSLNVRPIVSNDGSIALDTNLLQEIPQNSLTTLTKDTRSIKTQIILQNGDTAVLGGIFSGQESNDSTGVPFLRNLPLLGALFSSQTTAIDQNEVLIFITARILNPESAFKQKI
ncbi:MAG: hypothetical protein EBQ92_08855 [Proteobacteria bacterium]|nr:hypothetical protein [Pseudomonadota bacterium]